MSSTAMPVPLHQRRPLVLADLVPGAAVRDVLLVLGGLIGWGASVTAPQGLLLPG